MKTKLVILIVCVFILEYSEAQIKVSGFIETGYLSESYSMNKNELRIVGNPIMKLIDGKKQLVPDLDYVGNITNLRHSKCMYSDITLVFNWKWFTLEQEIYDIFSYEGGHTFKPLEIHYTTRIYADYKFIRVGYEHLCLHPIINDLNKFERVSRRSSYDKIFIRFSFNN